MIDNSPRHNAAFHVLHRLSMPRHPPCALTTHNKINTKEKNYSTHNTHKKACIMRTDARVHYTVLTHHTNHNQQTSKTKFIRSMVVNEQHTRAARDTQQRANAPNNYSLTTTLTQPSAHMMQETQNNKNAATHINNKRLCEQKLQHKHQPPTTME